MTGLDPSEFTLNRALQKSNLGEFAEADRLFADALARPTSDPVQLRLRRDFRAIPSLTQQEYATAATMLRPPVPPLTSAGAIHGPAVVTTPETSSAPRRRHTPPTGRLATRAQASYA